MVRPVRAGSCRLDYLDVRFKPGASLPASRLDLAARKYADLPMSAPTQPSDGRTAIPGTSLVGVALSTLLAVAMFVIAAVAVALSGDAMIRHRARGIPLEAPGSRFQLFAVGGVLVAAGLVLDGNDSLRGDSLVGLIGSLLLLAGIGLTMASKRASIS